RSPPPPSSPLPPPLPLLRRRVGRGAISPASVPSDATVRLGRPRLPRVVSFRFPLPRPFVGRSSCSGTSGLSPTPTVSTYLRKEKNATGDSGGCRACCRTFRWEEVRSTYSSVQ